MKSLFPALLLVLATGPVLAASESRQLARSDGGLINYTLYPPMGESAGLLVLAQGSGCAPGAKNPALATVRASFPTYTTLIVEKAGIAPDSPVEDGYADCPVEFHNRFTISQRVADYADVLTALRNDQDNTDRTIFFGGSEGGIAMAMLASHIRPDAVILMSSATGMEFGEMVRSTVPPEGHSFIDAGFAAARANPDSSELFAGSTHRFWADILDHRSIDYMRQSDAPFLLLQGGRDISAPIAAARVTADAFAAEGLCHLTYWEFPALDHGLVDPEGKSRLAQISRLAAQWAEHPMPAC